MCCAKSLLWCLTHCDPMNCSPQGSSVHGILQARILQWVTMPSSRGSCGPRDRIQVSYVSCIGREFFITAKSLQSCLTLCDPIDGSPPGSPVPGILQARTLEWVAISFSNAWKWPRGLQPTRLLCPWDFSRQEYWSGVPLPSPITSATQSTSCKGAIV